MDRRAWPQHEPGGRGRGVRVPWGGQATCCWKKVAEGHPTPRPNLLSTSPGTHLPASGPGELPGACPGPRPSPGWRRYRPAGRLSHTLGRASQTEVPVQATARVPSSSRSPGSVHRIIRPRPPTTGQMEALSPVFTAGAGDHPRGPSSFSLRLSFNSCLPPPGPRSALVSGWVTGEGRGASRTEGGEDGCGPSTA